MSSMRSGFETLYRSDTRAADPARSITVAVSLFNYERFISECLDSIAEQTYPDIELIIVDDCSTEDRSVPVTLEWIEAHDERFDRVLFLRHSVNYGLAAARNTEIGRAHV